VEEYARTSHKRNEWVKNTVQQYYIVQDIAQDIAQQLGFEKSLTFSSKNSLKD
jgi:hypothetical protein